jgi:hypothetical protein
MKNGDDIIKNASALIESIVPDKTNTATTIGLVHWNNIVNHCIIEGLGAKEILAIVNFIRAMAVVNLRTESSTLEEAANSDHEVDFTESIAFLTERQEQTKNKKTK